jgi:hypothetical protein
MTGAMEDLIHAHLDGSLDPAGEAALGAWLAASPENARAFAAVVLLHDRLRNVLVADREVTAETAKSAELAEPAQPSRVFRLRSLAVAGAVVAAVAVVLVISLSALTPVTAAAELERLIDAPAPAGDRTYRITSRDSVPDVGDDRQPPLDGAVLHVRNPDSYVLVRRFPDGRPFITGSDGERGWSVRPDGAVRVSADPLRFRGPLPGNQHGLPFVDPRSDLRHLRDAYAVTALPGAGGLRGLAFEKRSAEHRGPRRVEVWYDPRTRVIRRMEFEGLPRARGGPSAVSVELVEQRGLGPDFFRHGSHHGPDRKVIEED